MIFGLSDLCSADLQLVKAKGVTAAVGTATHSAVLESLFSFIILLFWFIATKIRKNVVCEKYLP